jgi:thioredoxin-dependent peroxiredoxin
VKAASRFACRGGDSPATQFCAVRSNSPALIAQFRNPTGGLPMKKPVLLACAAGLLFAGGVLSVRAADEPMPSVGQMAPTFTLPSQDGSQISLDSFHGKWVVLYFYPKDMTPGCTIEAHNFQRDQAKFDAANAVVLGVSVDTVDSHKQFCTKDNLTFKLLADPDHKVVDQYGSLGHYGTMTIANRNTFLINPEGKIVKVWTKVDPQHHSEEVLAALNEMKM